MKLVRKREDLCHHSQSFEFYILLHKSEHMSEQTFFDYAKKKARQLKNHRFAWHKNWNSKGKVLLNFKMWKEILQLYVFSELCNHHVECLMPKAEFTSCKDLHFSFELSKFLLAINFLLFFAFLCAELQTS